MTARIYRAREVFTDFVYLHLRWVVTSLWSPSRPPLRDVGVVRAWTREKRLPYPRGMRKHSREALCQVPVVVRRGE